MSNFEVCEEMQKLREWLNNRGIKWRDKSESAEKIVTLGRKEPLYLPWMCRTKFEIGDSYFSVINGVGSYGGCYLGGDNKGLLECMINGQEPEGYLKADDVIEKVKVCAKK